MLVNVVLLRRLGEPRPPRELRAEPGLVGTIRLYREPGGRVGQWNRVAALALPQGRSLELHEARLTRWDVRGLVLCGEERAWKARRTCVAHPQAWWCRPLPPGGSAPAPRDPIDLVEELEQMM
jgi:hypothetical protein